MKYDKGSVMEAIVEVVRRAKPKGISLDSLTRSLAKVYAKEGNCRGT